MADDFHFDPCKYHAQVSKIAQHVVAGDGDMATIAPQANVQEGAHHAAAVTTLDKSGRRVNAMSRLRAL